MLQTAQRIVPSHLPPEYTAIDLFLSRPKWVCETFYMLETQHSMRIFDRVGGRIGRIIHRLGLIARSDLMRVDQIRFTADEVFKRLGFPRQTPRALRLQDGCKVVLRPCTTDNRVFEEIFVDRIYEDFSNRIPQEQRPSVLVDLGANVGLSVLYLNRRFHFERVICVEPDSGNANALRQNLAGNIRAFHLVQAFVGGRRGFAKLQDPGFGAWGLRMGEASADGIPVMTLRDILAGDVRGGVLLKCDIEGAERYLFPQIAEWDSLVSFIILELHTEFFTWNQLLEVLNMSQYEWRVHGRADGDCTMAVLALERGPFRGERREPGTLQSGSDSRNHPRGAAAM